MGILAGIGVLLPFPFYYWLWTYPQTWVDLCGIKRDPSNVMAHVAHALKLLQFLSLFSVASLSWPPPLFFWPLFGFGQFLNFSKFDIGWCLEWYIYVHAEDRGSSPTTMPENHLCLESSNPNFNSPATMPKNFLVFEMVCVCCSQASDNATHGIRYCSKTTLMQISLILQTVCSVHEMIIKLSKN
ncbi:uncharacterized protein LOC100258621 isoform X1 [Vitis vinifera]|uniref:uncharacterized protein LOC100258621 isoform X1 n=1 Tax=Vitis vinifera TaxID=29760 RepID=UPI0028831E85|nr:uncharacterized protein LOC100258621 isoform X1 [Vitis vinifera]